MLAVSSLRIEQGVPPGARDLIWQSFFVEAGRGTTFERHLPWYRDADVRSVVVLDDGVVAATAVIRPAPQAEVAMIGYVCVDWSRRGQGVGRVLMDTLNDVVDEQGFRAALLWTAKPEVYTGRGYVVIGRDRFVRVRSPASQADDPDGIHVTDWPDAGTADGLPAFATGASRCSTDRATAVCAQGPRGVTLLDWQGEAVDVAAVLSTAGYTDWSVNLAADDPFVDTLSSHGYTTVESLGAFTMVRRQDVTFIPHDVPQVARI
ncbi:GNAT family N-acetyltransferase [Sphingomonas carotinifaciens]|uniref:GNAT family N-acetyltransferase n=1 Tax=Sphingomonas carotinifaciens TaxID=1166323 RepID=UPI000DD5506E|nr:GNAT family N-acetyltransferase [Sphingomonas carotinifaciens]